jgi:hypothetical protein
MSLYISKSKQNLIGKVIIKQSLIVYHLQKIAKIYATSGPLVDEKTPP